MWKFIGRAMATCAAPRIEDKPPMHIGGVDYYVFTKRQVEVLNKVLENHAQLLGQVLLFSKLVVNKPEQKSE